MSDHRPRTLSAIAQLIELHEQTHTDTEADERTLQQRDRSIALKDDFLKQDRRTQVLTWLNEVREPTIGYKVDHALWLIRASMIAVGLVAGCITAGGLFHYTGKQPVNVVHVLAVFVGLQLLLLVAWLMMALSAGRGVFDALSLFSPGRWVTLLLQRFDQSVREGFERAIGTAKSHTRVFGKVHKWLIIHLTQLLAVAFNISAIVTAISLVVFTDLAFGWGTTLEADGQTLHQITNTLSRPWAQLFPDAVPPRDLIDTTRIFRLEMNTTSDDLGNPEQYGGWWPFLIACMVVYGLAPRLITLAIARIRLKRVARDAVMTTPGVSQLFDRMHAPLVQTQATENEPHKTSNTTVTEAVNPKTNGAGTIVNWSDLDLTDDQAITLCRTCFSEVGDIVLHAGGMRDVDEDQKAIDLIRERPGSVVILVKAFEPPMGEFLDFVSDLRRAIGDGRSINVAPVDADSEQKDVWQKRLATLGDPWLAVRDVRREAGT